MCLLGEIPARVAADRPFFRFALFTLFFVPFVLFVE